MSSPSFLSSDESLSVDVLSSSFKFRNFHTAPFAAPVFRQGLAVDFASVAADWVERFPFHSRQIHLLSMLYSFCARLACLSFIWNTMSLTDRLHDDVILLTFL